MPTRKPRIALTVNDELNLVFDELSALTGRPKSKLITEFLEAQLPVFEALRDSLKAVKKGSPIDVIPFLKILGDSLGQLGSEIQVLDND